MNNRLIMYNINNIAKEKQLKELCNRLNIQTKRLNGRDTDKALAILAGVNAKAGNGMHANIKNGNIKTGSNLSTKSGNMPMILPEIIIFSGITDEELDTFLRIRAGILGYLYPRWKPVFLLTSITICIIVL